MREKWNEELRKQGWEQRASNNITHVHHSGWLYIVTLASSLAATGKQDCTFIPHFAAPATDYFLKTKIVKAHFESMTSFF